MYTISFGWVAVAVLGLICLGLVGFKLVTRAGRQPIFYPHLFRQMFRREGVDLQVARDETTTRELRRAVGTCSRCRNSEMCGEWLKNSQNTEAFRIFCPNAGLIERLMSRVGYDQASGRTPE